MEKANKILSWILFGCWGSLCIGTVVGIFEPTVLGYACATGCLAFGNLFDALTAGKK